MATRRKGTHGLTKIRAPKGTGGQSGFGNPRNNQATPEQQHDDAVRVLRAEYYQAVLGIVEELAQRIKDGEITDQEGLDQAMRESVEGSYWVIYTHANFQVIFASDNQDAYTEYGQAPLAGDEIDWAAVAYMAMERDVQQRFDAEGITVEHEEDLEEARHRPHRRVREPERDRRAAHEERRRAVGKNYSIEKSRLGWSAVLYDSRGHSINVINGDTEESVRDSARRNWPGIPERKATRRR